MIEMEKLGLEDIKEIVSVIFNSILDVSGLDSGGVYISNIFDGDMDLYYHMGLSEQFVQAVSHIHHDDPRIKLINDGKSLLLSKDMLKTAPPEDILNREGIKSLAILPITHKGRPIGCINIASHKKEMISEDLRDVVQGLIGQLSLVCNRVHVEQRLRESEGKFRTISEQSLMGLVIIQEGFIKYANQRSADLLGYSVEEFLALPMEGFAKLLHPDDRERAVEQGRKKQLGDRNTITNYQLRVITKLGKTVWLEVYSKTIKFRGKNADFITLIDITDKKEAEEKLSESEEKFRTIAEQSVMGIGIIQDGVVKYVNHTMSNIVEFSIQEMTTWDAHELFNIVHPEDREFIMNQMIRHMSGKKFGRPSTTYRFIAKSGKVKWLDVYTSNIHYQGRDALLSTLIDSTKRKEAEFKVLKYQEHLEELVTDRTKQLTSLVKELESFSYSVSHDLRAPLRAIDGFSKMILEDYSNSLDDQGKKYFYRIRAASQRMSQLIDDLLHLSHISRRKLRIDDVDLSKLTLKLLNELQTNEPEREVEIKVLPEQVVKGDSKLLRLVLENLLSNAWKFTSKHAHAVIEFGVQQVNGKSAFFLRDDGAGFDMTFAGKLFGPFQRLHSESEFDGLGIGLATVQRIIHRHGGEIWAEGAVEQGATFYFTINPIIENNET